MSTSGPRVFWLQHRSAGRRRIEAGGVLLGRSAASDIVLRDPRASRSHALVYLDGEVARLVVLGKGRTERNGLRVERETQLEEGDLIAVPGADLEVVTSEMEANRGQGWVLDRPGGEVFGVAKTPFVIGGSGRADLSLTGWPEKALTLYATQGRLHLCAGAALSVDGTLVEAEQVVRLRTGSRIAFGDQMLRVVAGGDWGVGSTILSELGGSLEDGPEAPPEQVAPHAVRLVLLPRGGRLQVECPESRHTVYLPGKRCDLMTLLIKPPTPRRPGDWLEDDILLARLWPRQNQTRVALNTLIYRLRRDLVSAGVDASELLARAPGGGATRLRVGADTVVELD